MFNGVGYVLLAIKEDAESLFAKRGGVSLVVQNLRVQWAEANVCFVYF